MSHKFIISVFTTLFVVVLAVVVVTVLSCAKSRELPLDKIVAAYLAEGEPGGVTFLYPPNDVVFPPDIVAPKVRWTSGRAGCDAWIVLVRFARGEEMMFRASGTTWTPSDEAWALIKQRSLGQRAMLTVIGVAGRVPRKVAAAATISFSTSRDEVGAPIFFREVNLPFLKAVTDPSKIRWRFGSIDSKRQPPIVLENLPVCGNCHSFSGDGKTLGMEVDSGNDKGAYAVIPVSKEMTLGEDRIISWSDYQRETKDPTFGLLCQVSPDGRYVTGTVKDQALAVYRPDLMFSQLFFLIKGIVAIYDRETGTIRSLPGADDRRYVQTNATWSPDGKTIVFAHAEAHDIEALRKKRTALVGGEDAEKFIREHRTYRYDLYRVPFNGGKGGKPEPVKGASDNGMSNYFAKFSPDGKWIVFCKARSYMLLQPDSELYIIPAEGGVARRLRCNTHRLNSWHSWSPNR